MTERRRWKSEQELALMIISKADKGQNVTLSPDTARFVGLKLAKVGLLPSRSEIVRILCRAKCERDCYNCIGTANEIVRAYGSRMPPDAGSA